MDVEQKARDALEAARSRGVRSPLRGFLPEAIIVECIAGALQRHAAEVAAQRDHAFDALLFVRQWMDGMPTPREKIDAAILAADQK